MFTGIVEATARVLETTSSSIILERPKSFTDLQRGSSVAVSGVCLTVVKLTKSTMTFDVVPETLKRTTLGELVVEDRARRGEVSAPRSGAGRSRVNLERALKVGDRFEGHIVQGHIDGVGKIMSVTPSPLRHAEELGTVLRDESSQSSDSPQDDVPGVSKHVAEAMIVISYPPSLKALLVEKGSIAIDGVSLTIASINDETFSVALIPHTLKETTLGESEEGDEVNLEADVLGRYVAQRIIESK